jgi:hypothetical protein
MDWLLQFALPDTDWDYWATALIMRFIGVFGVMAVMQLALMGASAAIQTIDRRRREPAPVLPPGAATAAPVAVEAGIDDATGAAIALAMDLEARPATADLSRGGETSSWAIAGRMAQLQRLPR